MPFEGGLMKMRPLFCYFLKVFLHIRITLILDKLHFSKGGETWMKWILDSME